MNLPYDLLSNHTSGYLSQKNKNLSTQENLHKDVYSNIICNNSIMETTKGSSVCEWVSKVWCIEILHRNTIQNAKEGTFDMYNNMNESQGNQAEWKMPISKLI